MIFLKCWENRRTHYLREADTTILLACLLTTLKLKLFHQLDGRQVLTE